MSSRVVLPDDELLAHPVAYRQVRMNASQPEPETSEDLQAQISRLQAEWEQRARQARADGLREGEAAGRSGAAAELQLVMERLARAIEELAQLRPRLRREAESDLIRLALAIARRVLRRELAVDPDALHGLVLAALEKLQGQEAPRVRVHPAQAASMRACLAATATGRNIEVVPDPALDSGGVVFETGRGNLDATVESQLQEIERGLVDRLHKSQ